MAVYKSKIDTWLAILIAVAMAAALFGSAMALFNGLISALAVLLLVAVTAGLPIWLYSSTCYELTDSTLLVRSGPFRWRIPLANIRDVAPTRSPLSSPALSLDRLRIDYGAGLPIMISPADKDGFLRDLATRRAAVR